MTRLLRESAVYSIGAAAAFATDVALLWALVEWVGLHYLLAASLSFAAGTAVVYAVSVRFAFEFRRLADRRAEFGVFATIGTVGILLNLVLMSALVELLDLHYLLAKVAAGAITFITNFAMRRLLLFTEWGARHRGSSVTSEQSR